MSKQVGNVFLSHGYHENPALVKYSNGGNKTPTKIFVRAALPDNVCKQNTQLN